MNSFPRWTRPTGVDARRASNGKCDSEHDGTAAEKLTAETTRCFRCACNMYAASIPDPESNNVLMLQPGRIIPSVQCSEDCGRALQKSRWWWGNKNLNERFESVAEPTRRACCFRTPRFWRICRVGADQLVVPDGTWHHVSSDARYPA